MASTFSLIYPKLASFYFVHPHIYLKWATFFHFHPHLLWGMTRDQGLANDNDMINGILFTEAKVFDIVDRGKFCLKKIELLQV